MKSRTERKIAVLKAEAARKRALASPAVRHTTAALRSIDSALAETKSAATTSRPSRSIRPS